MEGTPNSSLVQGDILKQYRSNILMAIQAGMAEKQRVYTPGALEVSRFYLGNHKYLFDPQNVTNQVAMFVRQDSQAARKSRQPIFQMSDNVAAKFLQIYSPYLLQGVINRTVEANKPMMPPPIFYGIDPEPMQVLKLQQFAQQPNGRMQAILYWQRQQQAAMQMQIDQLNLAQEMQVRQARADMLEMILNYSARELGYEAERKRVVEESLIMGGGVWLTQIVPFPLSGQKMIGSQYVMMNDIVWDPDATRAKDCKWLAIAHRAPCWLVSRIFGVPEADLRGRESSNVSEAYYKSLVVSAGPENMLNREIPKDEIVYWKFWSRMGSGARLKPYNQREPDLQKLDDLLGDYVFTVVSDSCDYPLNMGPNVFDAIKTLSDAKNQMMFVMPGEAMKLDEFQPLKQSTAWQIPFHLDVDDPWPVTTVEHYLRNGSPYPIPPLEFALSYMKFMVWVISFIADKTFRSMRTFIGIDTTTNEQLKTALQDAEDEAIIPIKSLGEKPLKNFLEYIDAPPMNKDILDVYQFMLTQFEQMTGMNEINQATMSRTMRSATEAGILDDASKLRPQAMAKNVLSADSRLARKEAIGWQYLCTDKDVSPILGDSGARAWQVIVKSIDPVQLIRETNYDVVASQGRIHDLSTRQDQANRMAQMVLPLLIQVAQATGNFGSVRAILEEWCKSNQIDPDKVLPGLPDMPVAEMNPSAPGTASAPSQPQPTQ